MHSPVVIDVDGDVDVDNAIDVDSVVDVVVVDSVMDVVVGTVVYLCLFEYNSA